MREYKYECENLHNKNLDKVKLQFLEYKKLQKKKLKEYQHLEILMANFEKLRKRESSTTFPSSRDFFVN